MDASDIDAAGVVDLFDRATEELLRDLAPPPPQRTAPSSATEPPTSSASTDAHTRTHTHTGAHAGGPAALQQLMLLVQTNAIRDVDLTSDVFIAALRLFQRVVLGRTSVCVPPALACVRAHTLVGGTISLPECPGIMAGHWGEAIGPAFVQGIVKQLYLVSEAALGSQEKAVDSMGAVTAITVADASQPMRGSLSSLHASAPATAGVPETAAPAGDGNAADIAAKRAAAVQARRPATAVKDLSSVAVTTLDELSSLRAMLYWVYIQCPHLRPTIESSIQTFFLRYSEVPVREAAAAVRALLQVALPIILGHAAGEASALARAQLTWLNALLPLHTTPGTMSETMAILGVFHEALAQCLLVLLRQSLWMDAPRVISAIVSAWPDAMRGNTTKAVLLIHEVDQVLQGVAGSEKALAVLPTCIDQVVPIICDALDNDNSRLVQVALGLFKQSAIVHATCAADSSGRCRHLERLLPVLYRNGNKHWNATVNKQTLAVLSRFVDATAPDALAKAADVLSSGLTVEHAGTRHAGQPIESVLPPAHAPSKIPRGTDPTGVAPEWTIRPAPVPHMPARHVAGGGQPPLTVTGVAPWAAKPHGAQPPVTITGVAPWASGTGAVNPPVTVTGIAPWASAGIVRPAGGPASSAAERSLAPRSVAGPHAGLRMLQAYMTALEDTTKPLDAARATALYGAAPDSSEVPPDLLADAPTLLPSLAFHDLVFGRELGSGTFSTVRYAKHIRRGMPGSAWPEYGVKIISTTVLRELGYEASARREMVVLSQLHHPNIARLVSAFRWRDGAYLVIEYAGKGDLHSTLVALGSIDVESVRFLLAEVLAAIKHVHDHGFSYGDCKPENILLLDAGPRGTHVKLADFGACRPLSPEAARLVLEAKDIIRNLRDGDWRAKHGVSTGAADATLRTGTVEAEPVETPDHEVGIDEDDTRLEGTEEYLAPELLTGGTPSIAADAFAFGLTLYQCLAGRLPDTHAIWPSGESVGADAAASRHVQFAAASTEPAFPAGFPAEAEHLVRQLLHPDPTKRLGANGFACIMTHPFFAALGAPGEIARLYTRKGPAVDAGAAAPPADPAWSRRHNSTMWAPLPKAYSAPTLAAAPPAGSASTGLTWRDLMRMRDLPAVPFV